MSDEYDSDASDHEQEELKRLETVEGGWGARKGAYYGGDSHLAAQDEEGHTLDDEEAEEVERQQKLAMKQMKDEDFMDVDEEDESESESSSEDDDDDEDDEPPKPKSKSRMSAEAEEVVRDPSRLSRNERLQIIAKESPELLDLLKEFKSSISQLKDQVEPLIEKVRNNELATEKGLSYLEVKQQVLLSYCTHIAFYLLLKAEGSTVKDHPVIGRLVELRTLLERMRPLDSRLRYQVDKLMKAAAVGRIEGSDDPLQYKPNPHAFVSDDEDGAGAGKVGKKKSKSAKSIKSRKAKKSRKDMESESEPESESEEEEREGEGEKEKVQFYRPPRIAAAHFPGAADVDAHKGRASGREANRLKTRFAKSQVARDVLDEFSERPEKIESVGISRGGVELEESDGEKERRRYEEENFVRLSTSKADQKKRERQRESMAKMDGIGSAGFNDIEDILSKMPGMDGDDGDGVGDDGLDAIYAAAANSKSRKKRRHDRDNEGEMDSIPWRGVDNELGEGDKRSATWSMIHNKGLSSGKKAVIPRVKHKNKYKKAVIKRRASGLAKEKKVLDGGYGGETTGIKSRTVRSVKLK